MDSYDESWWLSPSGSGAQDQWPEDEYYQTYDSYAAGTFAAQDAFASDPLGDEDEQYEEECEEDGGDEEEDGRVRKHMISLAGWLAKRGPSRI